MMTSANLKLKKTAKKWIYISVGLAVFILMAVGGFFLWKNWKSSDKSDSADEEVEDINEEEIPPEVKAHRKKNWINPVTGLSNYFIPVDKLPVNISVSRAKDELLELLWQYSGKNWDKKKIVRNLEKNAQQINLADKKGDETDPLFKAKLLEKVAEKYPQNIFSSLPNQSKFRKEIEETKTFFHFLLISYDLKYKGNKKIDWVASLRDYTKGEKRKPRTQQEKDFAKMTNHLEREINPFLIVHINQFPALNNLKELNRWANILARKEAAASRIAFGRFVLAEEIGKDIPSPAKEAGIIKASFSDLKNEKFDLIPNIRTFKP